LEVARELPHFCKMARRSKVVGLRWSNQSIKPAYKYCANAVDKRAVGRSCNG